MSILEEQLVFSLWKCPRGETAVEKLNSTQGQLGEGQLIIWSSLKSRSYFEESGGRSNKKKTQNATFIF